MKAAAPSAVTIEIILQGRSFRMILEADVPTGLPAERPGPPLLTEAPTLRPFRSIIAMNRLTLQGLERVKGRLLPLPPQCLAAGALREKLFWSYRPFYPPRPLL